MKPRYTITTSLREVNCTDYVPIVQHPYFTALNNKTQLSFVDKVYRGAKHSRLDHSVFVFHFADEITNHLVEKGCINKEDKKNIEIASLLHDIRHPPYSHASEFVIEALGNIDHKIKATKIIENGKRDRSGRNLKDCIKECKGDAEVVKEIILKQNKLSQIISHNTLGADKTGYVLLDSNRTFYFVQMPYLLDIFTEYFFDGNKLGLENERKEFQIQNLQRAYQDLYIDVYFHPTVRFYERLFERSIQTGLEDRLFSVEDLWDMEEHEINYLLKIKGRTNEFFEKIQREEMDEEVLSINYDPANEKEFKKTVDFYSNPLNLTKVENRIAEEFNCENHQITCTLTVIPDRIIPEDVFVFSWGKSIFENSPDHYKSLIEKANRKTSIKLYKDPKIDVNLNKCEKIILETPKN